MNDDGGDSQEGDIWLSPADYCNRGADRSKWTGARGGVCFLLALATYVLGIVLLTCVNWTNHRQPKYQWYLMGTLCLELVCLTLTGLALLLIAVCLGRSSLIYSLSLFSLINDFFLSCTYATSLFWGGFILLQLNNDGSLSYPTIDTHPLPVNDKAKDKWIFPAYTLYTVLTTLTCFKYSLAKAPALLGVCHAAYERIHDWCNKVPIVSFYSRYNRADDYYIRALPADDYADYVVTMPDPFRAMRQPVPPGQSPSGQNRPERTP